MLKISVIAIGRMGRGPEAELAQHYANQFSSLHNRWRLTMVEIDDRKAPSDNSRKRWDADQIFSKCGDDAALISLDERGKAMSSLGFAQTLARFEDQARPVCFAIGGPDGLDDSVRKRSDHCFSFGTLTWPHRLVRVMLAEQLYRAAAIDAGHPYHREG
ncbi:MAG: 23S rRNA (pseudouridine(1915)-N(3))-methyltransferase RlmH [Pseudomonadota bacterium]